MITFVLGTRCVVQGSSGSGKSELIKKILLTSEIFEARPKNIFYYCPSILSISENLRKLVIHKNQLPSHDDIEWIENLVEPAVMVFDDFQEIFASEIISFLSRVGRHFKVYIFLITQNLFPKQKFAVEIMQNMSDVIIFNSPRGFNSVKILSCQCCFFGEKSSLSNAYIKACSSPFSYLYICLRPGERDFLRFQTDILNPYYKTIILPESLINSTVEAENFIKF